MIFTACEGGLDNEENGGNPSTPKIELSQQSVEVAFESAQYSVSVTSPYSWEATSKNDWIIVDTKSGVAGTKELKFSVECYGELEIREGTIVIKNEDYNLVAELYVTQKAFVPAITIESESLLFAFEGGTQEVAITANFEEYEYSTNTDWLTIKKSENGISVTVPNYVEVEERTAEITISNEKYGVSKVISVTQGAFVPAITIEPETLTFAIEGGTQEIAITVNFEYEASANADWLTIEKSDKGISVTVPNYVEVEERTAEITISNEKYGVSKVINITQGAFVPTITIEPESLLFTFEGGIQEVAVTTNFEYEYSTNADWLTIKKSKKGISVTAQNNVEVDERTAEITISNEKYGFSKVVNITQGAFVPTITIEPESLTFASEGSMQQVTVTANFEYAYSANADWLTITKSRSGIKVTAKANANFEERTAEITISSEKYGVSKAITIMQQGVSAESQNVILYTSSDGKIVTPYKSDVFGANIVSNTYRDGQGIIIFDGPVTSIGDDAFFDCTSLTSATIGNGVTSIGNYAFYGCTSLTSVTIPDNVTKIGGSAFQRCSSLTNITIPDSVTSIGYDAFRDCSSLTSVTIGNSVTTIGGSAFNGCTSLTSVTIPDSVTWIGNEAFYGCTGELIINSKIVKTNYTYDNYPANPNNGWLYGAKFTKVTIGNSVTSIGEYAFRYCRSLTSVTIGNSVTSIGDEAFLDCSSLTSVTIGNSVTSIGSSAFEDCTSLKTVYCKPTTPPAGDWYMFSYYSYSSGFEPIGCKIYVPRNSVEAYKAAEYWRGYASSIVGYDF